MYLRPVLHRCWDDWFPLSATSRKSLLLWVIFTLFYNIIEKLIEITCIFITFVIDFEIQDSLKKHLVTLVSKKFY